jgi:hypothetical protein
MLPSVIKKHNLSIFQRRRCTIKQGFTHSEIAWCLRCQAHAQYLPFSSPFDLRLCSSLFCCTTWKGNSKCSHSHASHPLHVPVNVTIS